MVCSVFSSSLSFPAQQQPFIINPRIPLLLRLRFKHRRRHDVTLSHDDVFAPVESQEEIHSRVPSIPLPSSHFHLPTHTFVLTQQEQTNNVSSTPRERNINYFTGPIERGTQRVAIPVERTVKRIDNRLPLERMALSADKRIKNGIERVGLRS